MSAIDALSAYLRSKPPGELDHDPALVQLLEEAWSGLRGGREEAMAWHKVRRLERPRWKPPVLTFLIERHGGTTMGSTRAEMQRWTVDLSHRTAMAEHAGHRQLSPMATRVNVRPIAEEIAALVLAGAEDPRFTWKNTEKARVFLRIGSIVPSDGFAQTVSGRRKRFRAALEEIIRPHGWEEVFGGAPWVFQRVEGK